MREVGATGLYAFDEHWFKDSSNQYHNLRAISRPDPTPVAPEVMFGQKAFTKEMRLSEEGLNDMEWTREERLEV